MTAEEYRKRGFLARASPLADTSIVAALLADEPLFASTGETQQAQGRAGVPYLVTDSIRRACQDPAILSAITPILGTTEWLMWGANIRRATPNQAHAWHVDLESLLWPTITVAVGLSGCAPDSATWCIPGTHAFAKAPPSGEAAVLAHGDPEQIAGFGDGRFYVFDARVWHRGDPATSRDRVMLFLHYHRARDRRIPWMLDYRRHEWSHQAAPYFATLPAGSVCQAVARLPLAYRLGRVSKRMLGR